MSGSTRILVRCFQKEWRALGVAMLGTVLLTLAALAAPVPLALVVERVVEKSAGSSGGFELTDSDLWLLAAVAALVLGVAAVQGVVTYISDVSLTRASERIVHDLRLATHMHLQRLSLLFHARRHTGDLVTRVTGDVNAVGSLFAESLATVFSAVLLLTGMLVVSLIIDPVLALVAFAVTPLLGLASFQARKKLKSASRLARARDGEIASLTTESFAAIREVKAFGSEPYEHGRLRSKSEERLRAGYDLARIQGRFARVVDVIGSFGTAAVLVVGVFRVASGAIGAGELVVMVSYAGKVYRPLRDMARQVSRISRSMARAERITEILAADDVLEERADAYDGPPARGALELDAVSFSYEPDRPALANVSLKIEPGTKLALVGRSGAGKSTIAALIARFYDPTSGRVLVDGRDVRDCSLTWLRRQVGLVLQDTVLFSGTVAENIAYGIEVGQDEIETAAKAAGAHEFISQLPNGYATELGQRGVGLSGGQRQRIAIARTLLRDPSILILDEPTTGLDAESEAEVLDGLSRLMRGRTTVVISHSSRLLERADRAVSIEHGRIVRDIRAERPADIGSVARNLLRTVTNGLRRPEAPPRVSAEPPGQARVPVKPGLPRLPVLEDIVGAPLALEELKRKPGRRRTMRAVGPKRSAIVKAYESERAPIVAARLRALAARPTEPEVPEVLHVDPSLRLVVLSEVVGAPLRDALLSADLAQCSRAGAALGAWHAFWLGAAPPPLESHTYERELAILLRAADRAEPAIGERVRQLASSLSAEWPITTVVHRDLYEEQILLGQRVGLIDLDDAALGPPELDVGNLLAHIELLELRTGANLAPAVEALLSGYGADSLDQTLLDRCRGLTLLRLACIHGLPECIERVRTREELPARNRVAAG